MRDAMHAYFTGEKWAGITLAIVGLCALVWVFLIRRGIGVDFRGMVWPLGVIGLLQVAIGVGLAAKTPSQLAGLESKFNADAPAFYSAETERMTRVQRNFVIIEIVEIVLLLAGIGMAFTQKPNPLLWGIGLGIVLQAGVMLVFDLMAEQRGSVYVDALRLVEDASG